MLFYHQIITKELIIYIFLQNIIFENFLLYNMLKNSKYKFIEMLIIYLQKFYSMTMTNISDHLYITLLKL